jgi:hypothetical protein
LRHVFILWAAVLLAWIVALTSSPAGTGSPEAGMAAQPGLSLSVFGDQLQEDCDALLDDFTRQEGWLDELIDPVLTSEQEIAGRLEEYEQLVACLDSAEAPLPEAYEKIRRLAGYFLTFAGGSDHPDEGWQFFLVDLAESDDPAVVELREEAGLPPPPGYVYVRLYDSRQAMPPLVAGIFSDPQVAGVTINTRYIAVLADSSGSVQRQILQRQALPRTISHELVHAYVHSSLRPNDYTKLPEWFNEGVAIYFSKSGENHTLITPNATLVRTTTAEYLRYKENFDYLEDRLGRERLLELIVQAIQGAEPALVYQELGIQNEQYLRSFAQGWRENQVRRSQIYSLAFVSVLALLVIWMVPSEVRCQCGYAGHKREFEQGYCPNCRRPMSTVNRLVRRRPARLTSDCQVCGRRYWLWNSRQVHVHPSPIKAWVKRQGDELLDEPRRQPVERICRGCQQEHLELAQQHEQAVRQEIEASRERIRISYRTWLENAPQVSIWFQDGLQMFPFEQALELFVLAALYPRYGSWLEDRPDFQLRQFFQEQPDAVLDAPPRGYENVLVRVAGAAGMHARLLGTVRRFEDGQVGIHWVPG